MLNLGSKKPRAAASSGRPGERSTSCTIGDAVIEALEGAELTLEMCDAAGLRWT
jgi:hypothetical protein